MTAAYQGIKAAQWRLLRVTNGIDPGDGSDNGGKELNAENNFPRPIDN